MHDFLVLADILKNPLDFLCVAQIHVVSYGAFNDIAQKNGVIYLGLDHLGVLHPEHDSCRYADRYDKGKGQDSDNLDFYNHTVDKILQNMCLKKRHNSSKYRQIMSI
jgi:hypothetical protein